METTAQQELEEILKKKGIGPQGSKSLQAEDLQRLPALLVAEETSLTTRCTLLFALLLLEQTEEEKSWLRSFAQSHSKSLPFPLESLLNRSSREKHWEILYQLLDKQELSESDCQISMNWLLDPSMPEYWKGCFLEGERLKRESAEENQSFFSFLWKHCQRKQVNLPMLIDLADNYDGFNRYSNVSLFMAPTLAACGIPALVHGLDEVAPKRGYTHRKLLELAGKKLPATLEESVAMLQNHGWTYADQSFFFPELFALKKMRKEMVKRPFLATFEKLLQPIQASKGNYIVSGYTHSHYKEEVIQQLQQQATCAQALIVKGLEGNLMLPLARATTLMHFDGSSIRELPFSPEQAGLALESDVLQKNIQAEDVLKEGLEALQGRDNPSYRKLLYLGYCLAATFGFENPTNFQNTIKEALQSGKAYAHWNSFTL
ncbi:MAG: hypothetical protein MUF42_12470 [Cytophagaceae bacterium]|jgi:anthranilate phosphoribosyltransferase|nr:hypothetical protein [Cytophagaceae bacterium]